MLKLNLGCGPLPLHPQHLKVMTNPSEWTLVDKFVNHPDVKKWDAEILMEVANESCDHIYASHLLEHIAHVEVPYVLDRWHKKLAKGGQLTINVPDLAWAAKQVLRFEAKQMLSGLYTDFEGEHGLQSVVYGTQSHEGEYHKSGYTKTSLEEMLDGCGFKEIKVEEWYDAHDMGVLFATCKK